MKCHVIVPSWHLHVLCYFILLANGKYIVLAQNSNTPAPEFNHHSIVQPVLYHARTKRELSSTSHTEGLHHQEVTLKINVDDESYILDLKLNKELVPDGHVLSYRKDGKIVQHKPTTKDLNICQYSGSVRHKPGSWAAVSTCHGVRGVIYDGQHMRYIQPAQNEEINSNHYLYKQSDFDVGNTHKCGQDDTHKSRYTDYGTLRTQRFKRESSDDTLIQEPYYANNSSRYIELVLIADHGLYMKFENLSKVHTHMKDIANVVNSLYSPLNVIIALVEVVVWIERNEIPISNNASETLYQLQDYINKNNTFQRGRDEDNVHLITTRKFIGNNVGNSFQNGMCDVVYREKDSTYLSVSCGLSLYYSSVVGVIATTVAHELGHNLGMSHDNETCACPDKQCIMTPEFKGLPVNWSTCSKESIQKNDCLRNKPKSLFESPTCGNGFVEPGEDCDCGAPIGNKQWDLRRTCCDPYICTFRGNFTRCSPETCVLSYASRSQLAVSVYILCWLWLRY